MALENGGKRSGNGHFVSNVRDQQGQVSELRPVIQDFQVPLLGVRCF